MGNQEYHMATSLLKLISVRCLQQEWTSKWSDGVDSKRTGRGRREAWTFPLPLRPPSPCLTISYSNIIMGLIENFIEMNMLSYAIPSIFFVYWSYCGIFTFPSPSK